MKRPLTSSSLSDLSEMKWEGTSRLNLGTDACFGNRKDTAVKLPLPSRSLSELKGSATSDARCNNFSTEYYIFTSLQRSTWNTLQMKRSRPGGMREAIKYCELSMLHTRRLGAVDEQVHERQRKEYLAERWACDVAKLFPALHIDNACAHENSHIG